MSEQLDFKVGDRIYVDAIENFGGPASIVETRNVPGSHYKVRMDDDNPPPFWAHDFEVTLAQPADGRYDSRVDTFEHIRTVRHFLSRAIRDLEHRREVHDRSKLDSPEVEVFDEFTPKLAGTTYGSDEYRSYLAAMKPALDHHYAANSHHPEHYPDGIRGMSLLDIVEMLVDWKAATLRHDDGDIRRSIEINQERFGYSDELKSILLNTLPVIENG